MAPSFKGHSHHDEVGMVAGGEAAVALCLNQEAREMDISGQCTVSLYLVQHPNPYATHIQDDFPSLAKSF